MVILLLLLKDAVQESPALNEVPPVGELNQLTVSFEEVLMVAVPGPQMEVVVAAGAAGIELMIALTSVRLKLLQVVPASA